MGLGYYNARCSLIRANQARGSETSGAVGADAEMKPYYDMGGITLYHGDCREVLDDLYVDIEADVVITDPPYGSSRYETGREVLSSTMLNEFVSRGPVGLFGYAEKLTALCVAAAVVPSEWITWWPTNAACRGFLLSGLRREAEHVAIFGDHRGFAALRQTRGESSQALIEAGYQGRNPLAQRGLTSHGDWHTRRLGDVWTDPAPGLGFNSHQRQHPNEKPLSVMRRLVEGLTKPGEAVLDPFMGSGTTIRAAKDLGRRAIGIEIEEHYCEIAAQRLGQEVLDLDAA